MCNVRVHCPRAVPEGSQVGTFTTGSSSARVTVQQQTFRRQSGLQRSWGKAGPCHQPGAPPGQRPRVTHLRIPGISLGTEQALSANMEGKASPL